MQQHRCYFCEEQDYLMKQTTSYNMNYVLSPEEIALEMDTEARSLSDVSDLVKEIIELNSDLIQV